MKKLFTLALVVSAFTLTACSEFFLDPTAIHNGLVDRMDNVLAGEQDFYDEYFNIQDGESLTQLDNYQENFAYVVEELDRYFSETTFHSSQEVFVTEYENYYKDAVMSYVADSRTFVDALKADGPVFNLEVAEPYFENIDEHGQAFVEIHNNLIDTINLQADY